ncbi:MAG: lysophospholipid acyltransferase family protein [Pseudobdellovibrio sp.]
MSVYLNVRAFLRLVLFLFLISSYVLFGLFLYLIIRNPFKRRGILIRNGSRFSRLLMKTFGVRVSCINPIPKNEVSLLVGNHIGFIDILCLQALQPSVFITSLEMKNTPGLGQICEVAGCAYVNRKSRMNIKDELQNIVDVLKEGFRVVLYAESIASNGEQVLPFKKTLMMSAGYAEVPIRPFVFNFVKINQQKVDIKYRDSVCWYGDQSFLSSIWRSLKLDSVECEIEFLPLVNIRFDDDRTEVAQKIHLMVSSKFRPFIPIIKNI